MLPWIGPKSTIIATEGSIASAVAVAVKCESVPQKQNYWDTHTRKVSSTRIRPFITPYRWRGSCDRNATAHEKNLNELVTHNNG